MEMKMEIRGWGCVEGIDVHGIGISFLKEKAALALAIKQSLSALKNMKFVYKYCRNLRY